MAAGRQAFGAATPGMIIEAVLTRSPVPLRTIRPEIPPRLEEIIDQALHKKRALRYQRAADVRDDLQRLERSCDSALPWKTAQEQTLTGFRATAGPSHAINTENARLPVHQTTT